MTPENKGKISDGYHTFDELYEHRHTLFICILRFNPLISWRSKLHSDGTMFPGWFIAGVQTPLGPATYHMPLYHWDALDMVETLDNAPEWDGHTSNDVLERIALLVPEGE